MPDSRARILARYVVRLLEMWYPFVGALLAMFLCWHFRAEARVFRVHEIASATPIFSGLLTFSALLASVLLSLVAILATLDSRPIVQDIRSAKMYSGLINSALHPLIAFIILAATSVLALLATNDDNELFRRVVVTFALSTATFGILSTARFASLLVRIMMNPKGDKSPWDPKDTPAGAEERGARDITPRSHRHVS